MEYLVGIYLLVVLVLLLKILEASRRLHSVENVDEKKLLLLFEQINSKLNSMSYEISEIKNKDYNDRNRNWQEVE